MNKNNWKNFLLEKITNKRGEIDLGGGENNTNENQNLATIVQDAFNTISKKIDAITSSYAKVDGKNVDENIKSEILTEVKKQFGGRSEDDVKTIETLTKQLEVANKQNKAYALEKELKVIGEKVGINKDGMDLFSQLIKTEQAYDEKGNLKNDFLEGEAKNFIKKYNVFSSHQKKDFGVSALDYVGIKEKQSVVDVKKLSTSKRLEMYYNEQ